MATDPDDGDEDDEWRFSLEDLEESEDSEDSEDAGSAATESSGLASGGTASSDAAESREWAHDGTASGDESAADVSEDSEDGEGLSAGVAGRMEFDEKLEAGEIDVENAFFVVLGVVLAVAFFVAFLNLL